MGERRACPWWWWGWPRRRRRARRLLSRRRVPRRQLSRRRLSRWRLSRRRFSRQRLSRREGVRRQARLRRQAVLPASWVLRARRIRRGGAGLRRRLLVRPALLRVSVPLVPVVCGSFVRARIHPAGPRAAPILVLVRRPRGLLPLHPGLPGRLATGSASAPARILIGQRSAATPCVLSEGATSYPSTRTSATVRPYLSSPRDSTVTGPEASSRCKRSRAPSSRKSRASTPATR